MSFYDVFICSSGLRHLLSKLQKLFVEANAILDKMPFSNNLTSSVNTSKIMRHLKHWDPLVYRILGLPRGSHVMQSTVIYPSWQLHSTYSGSNAFFGRSSFFTLSLKLLHTQILEDRIPLQKCPSRAPQHTGLLLECLHRAQLRRRRSLGGATKVEDKGGHWFRPVSI